MTKRVRLFAATAGLVASLAAPTPASATTAEGRVDAFFTEYRLAVLGEIEDQPHDVRRRFVDPLLNARLSAWGAAHEADPVFRAHNIPRSWSVRPAGGNTVVLTETWYEGGSQGVRYVVRPADLRIIDLGEPP